MNNVVNHMKLRPYFGKYDYQYLERWINGRRIHALWCADLIPYPVTAEAVADILEKDAREWGGHAYIATGAEHEPIGFLSYSVNPGDNSGFLKFVILNPDLRGQGYGTQMIQCALRHAFDITGVDSVRINVFDVNTAARRCYEKAGFHLESTTEAAFRYGEECWDRCGLFIRCQDYRKAE